MSGDATDAYADDKRGPALVDGSGDPKRSLSVHAHETELPPLYNGEPTARNEYFDHDLPIPTEEDLATLRRVSEKIPFKAYTIAFVELVERLSYYGTTQVFVNFIQQPNPGTSTGRALDPSADDAQPGALGMGQQASTGLTTFNQFWVYVIPLFGAYVADTYWGRFKTIWISVLTAIVGHVILTSSAAPSVIAAPHHALAAFVIGLIIMGIGTGGFKPNISPLVAEQIPGRMYVRTTKKGERVIVDPAVTTARVYNWFYLFINVGALVGQLSMAYAERYVGFYLSFLLPTVLFCATLPILYVCRDWYKHTKPEGSVLAPAVKLLLLGTVKRFHLNPVTWYKHLHDGTFWDDLKPSKMNPATRPAWVTFDDAWVDEVSRGWKACSVFLWLPLYWLTYNQLNGNLTSQASTMALHGIPNDVLSNLDPFALIICIPICDLFIYPALRRAGIHFTPVKKIAAGFFMGSAAMVWACVVQAYIYKKSACGNHASDCPNVDINVWAQTGAYVLIAISEIFASITSLEYGFSKAPKNMRSLVAAFALFMSAISAALGEAFNPLSADPLLVWNYGSMAVISFVGGSLFWLSYRKLDKQEDELNMLPTGHLVPKAQVEDIEMTPSFEKS
ncbi:POT family-domain-containing protein [Fomitopsis serialis]|uniref:POT family-domain-containing protein n=1 Tax=Fomitopsis serialis TaxID=139415 RepID=UPI002007A218|nr:POT family-domain-containing protein [Neoantrodia serialis]KAH9930689.1 POT family-domain-containing protein [Neoantrodia serialis]